MGRVMRLGRVVTGQHKRCILAASVVHPHSAEITKDLLARSCLCAISWLVHPPVARNKR